MEKLIEASRLAEKWKMYRNHTYRMFVIDGNEAPYNKYMAQIQEIMKAIMECDKLDVIEAVQKMVTETDDISLNIQIHILAAAYDLGSGTDHTLKNIVAQ